MKRSLMLVCFGILLAAAGPAKAQVIPPAQDPEEDSIQYTFVPVAGYNSDFGLFGGVLLQRFNYGSGNQNPFLSNTRFNMTASTKANYSTTFDYIRTQSFGTDIRSRIRLDAERNKLSNYFGIGNNTLYSGELYDDEYFYFENRQVSLIYRARKTIHRFHFNGIIDLILPVSVSYQDASDRGKPSKFEEDFSNGLRNGWVNKTGIGLVADNRDSEFAPTEGARYEAMIQTSQPFLGSDYAFTDFILDLRHYVEIIDNVVIAQKIEGRHVQGAAPFWEMAALGNEDGLRGFHIDRFLGDSSILHLLEARVWLFSFYYDEIRIGGQFFWDTGRVFSDVDSKRFFTDWKQAYGVGGAMSLFNSDFILRGDIGFSDETSRIYIGMGYVF